VPLPKRIFSPGNFDLQIKRSRTGRGMYALSPIPKGACIIEYTGRPATLKQFASNKGKYLFWTSDSTMIDGNISGNKARFINHSCVPNCEIDLKNERVYVFAKRNIRPGEELTYDYGKEYFDMYLKGTCRCPRCARRETGDFARTSPPQLQ
jgi:uncharacterized protein